MHTLKTPDDSFVTKSKWATCTQAFHSGGKEFLQGSYFRCRICVDDVQNMLAETQNAIGNLYKPSAVHDNSSHGPDQCYVASNPFRSLHIELKKGRSVQTIEQAKGESDKSHKKAPACLAPAAWDMCYRAGSPPGAEPPHGS